ncbi:MAG: tetratricopeptide repeat protein [Candidatus Omnitrophota bacterium]
MKKFVMVMFAVLAAVGIQPVQAQPAPATASAINFGDFKSSTLATKAWQALNNKNLDAVLAYTNKCVEMYGAEAAKMQMNLKEYPAGESQLIFSFWALNDVSTSLYIQGEAYRVAQMNDKAKVAFERVVREFSFGQAYDPASKSFWKPADAAKDKLDMMAKGLNLDFGDMRSSTLVQRMWGALGKKDLEAAAAYYNKLSSLYGETARKMQAGMTEYAWESPEKIHSFWALNDVGTGTFIMGELYRLVDKKAEASAMFQKLVSDYLYAQCWDTNGWFWKPAEAAQQKLIELDIPAVVKK